MKIFNRVNLKEILKPQRLNKLLLILSGMVILAFVFSAGVLVGHERARFSRAWGDNYYGNIIGPGGRGPLSFGRPGFNAHSGLGQIIKIEGDNITVKGTDNVEKTIIAGDQTAIRQFNQTLKLSDLKIDQYIVVIGAPNNQGQVDAKLIRIVPDPMVNNFKGVPPNIKNYEKINR